VCGWSKIIKRANLPGRSLRSRCPCSTVLFRILARAGTLIAMKKLLKLLLPPVLLLPYRRAKPFSTHRGNFSHWSDAVAAADGYDTPAILDKQRNAARKVRDGAAIYERDSVLFGRIEYSFPMLAALLLVSGLNRGNLTVLDFGGALGSSYYQNRGLLKHVALRWHIVDQPQFVKAGKAEFENASLKFFPSIDEAWAAGPPDLVLLSSVLQYLEEPFEFLADIVARGPRFILVDRTPVLVEGQERIVVETGRPDIYTNSYPCRLFAPGMIAGALGRDYCMPYDFDTHVGTVITAEDARATYRGYFFQRGLA
jgi:putative methyltransferase (TIGR04325 family)